jgi:hypothetical protein
MAELRRYRSIVFDSIRWAGFPFRPDDIVISTPPKSGTTWMQMLCAMVVLGTDRFDRPLADISPWLDGQLAPLSAVVTALESQEHRRFIKTHTPLDGLPCEPGVTYICVGRDPRDVSQSWLSHMANMDGDAFLAARTAAVGHDDGGLPPLPAAPPPTDPIEWFWGWVDGDPGEGTRTLKGALHHLQTFWDRRDEPGIVLFHYSDLLADLPGQLSRLAQLLRVAIPDDRIIEFAAAAGFEQMKERADDLVPDARAHVWQSNRDFFHRGTSGQWRQLLDESGQARYAARVGELVSPDLGAWAHAGWLGTQS